MNNQESQQNEDKIGWSHDESLLIERAITDAQYLVAFAAKTGIEVDEKVLDLLITAKTKWDAGQWSTEFEVQFWEAFTQMNHLLKPVTVASVRATFLEPRHKGIRGFFQNQYGRNEANQSITRYTLWTLGVLFVVLLFQIYWVVGNSLAVKLTELLDNEIVLTDAINQANLDYSEIEVRFKLAESEGRDSQTGANYEFYHSPDWTRETLQIIAERQKLEDELEALKTQLDRNSAILLSWSTGWQWIILGDGVIDENPELKAQIEDLQNQIDIDQALISETEVQKEINAKKEDLAELEAQLADVDEQLTFLINQAQNMDTADSTDANESGTVQVDLTFEEQLREKDQIRSNINELRTWLGQTDLVKILMAQRQTNLDALKAEKAALTRQLEREVTKEESRRVRLSTDFALIILQSYLLPVLYGLLGASVFVLRTLTREVTNVTFSEDSNRSYLLRLALGTLSGLIIGWFVFLLPGQSILGSISPLAIAFLVGYNIEIVFSLMDRLIKSVTKPEQGTPAGPSSPDAGQPGGENKTEPKSPATV